MEFVHLSEIAKIIRRKILQQIYLAGSGHPGGSLSAVEIGTALYFKLMKYNPKNPEMQDRDRFILSKGHAAPLLYALLSEAGFFEDELLNTLRKIDSPLQGHPNALKCKGVDVSTGSLGQGLSVACGMAVFSKKYQIDNYIYSLHGDGELNEGQIWEAVMFAAHHKLNNIIAFIDRNYLQLDGSTESILQLEPLSEKFKAFGWNVYVVDGHSFSEIINSVESAKNSDKPNVIIANTTKGKGVSFMEGVAGWHGKAPNKNEYEAALKEIG